MKDGLTTTSKYDNDNIRFKIPNVVMVFSNHNPDFRRLSADRWRLYTVTSEGGLKAVSATDLTKKAADASRRKDEPPQQKDM